MFLVLFIVHRFKSATYRIPTVQRTFIVMFMERSHNYDGWNWIPFGQIGASSHLGKLTIYVSLILRRMEVGRVTNMCCVPLLSSFLVRSSRYGNGNRVYFNKPRFLKRIRRIRKVFFPKEIEHSKLLTRLMTSLLTLTI